MIKPGSSVSIPIAFPKQSIHSSNSLSFSAANGKNILSSSVIKSNPQDRYFEFYEKNNYIIYIHPYICTYLRMYVHTYIHTYMYIHTYIYTYVRTYIPFLYQYTFPNSLFLSYYYSYHLCSK